MREPPVEPLRQLALVPDGAPVRVQPVAAPFTEVSVKAPTPVTDRVEPLSMSSKEIAELTGKMTYHVNRDIRTMLSTFRRDDPVLDHVREVRDERGYIAVFNLPKDLTLTLVSGYNVQMRHRIITRWLELEEATRPAPTLTTFEFLPGHALRIIDINGDPWFIAKDACDVLGYAHTPGALAKHVDDDDRQPFNLNTVRNWHRTPGNPRVSTINESGLYSLILGSKMPKAKEFKRWVTSVVLPATRKDGAYIKGEEKVVNHSRSGGSQIP